MNFAPRLGVTETVRDLVDRMARLHPDRTYLIAAETGRITSFEDLRRHAQSFGAEFLRLGLGKGDKIAFLMDNSAGAAELFLGTMYCGLVIVPLNVRGGVAQIAYMLEHSDAKVVYVQEKYRDLLREASSKLERAVKAVFVDPDAFSPRNEEPYAPLPLADPHDPAMLIYSSGTTGNPKGALHTHRSIMAHGRNSILAHELTSDDRSLLVLPLYHINAECVTLIPTLISGGSVVVARGFLVSEFWNWLDDYRCTWSALVPTIIAQLLDWKDPKAESRADCFRRIRFLRSSSAPLSPALHREFLDKFGLPLLQAMGSSEGGNVFSNPVPPGVNKIGSPGLSWGFDLRIVGREGEDLPAGEPGEMLIRGEGMMQGYYKDPAGTAAALDAEQWLHTGDLAYRDEDGYVFIVGRSKELIIKGGMNIAPKQIDEVLESHPAVLEAAAVGVPDRYVGEDVVAFAVLRDKGRCDEQELLGFCEARLGLFKTPSRIHFVADLPKGPSGKVQRLKLQDEAASRSAPAPQDDSGTAPAAATASPASIEEILLETWSQLLKQPKVDPQANFFSLGGDSLLAIQCLAQLRDKLPIRLCVRDFFENATVAEQAALIRRRLAEAETASQAPDASEAKPPQESGRPADDDAPRDLSLPSPLSPNQRRIWFMDQVTAGEPVYNEAEAARLTGDLNVEALRQALDAIVARRENLRSTVRIVDDEPFAVVHNPLPMSFKTIDLRSLPKAARDAEVERLLIDEPRRPYRLEEEPAVRFTLLRVGDAEHIIILMMHHFFTDWTSVGNFWRDLSALYAAGCAGRPIELPDLHVQHRDYASSRNRNDIRAETVRDLAYWRERLQGAPALLELPTDRPRPPVFSYRGAKRRYAIPPALTKALRERSRKEKVSLFSLFAAALDTLLYRYTGQEDLSLGIPLADRDENMQTVIGFLLHTHVLRTRLSGDMSFRELLCCVQKDVLDLYVHRSPPFDEVVSALQPPRSPSYSPLFQVMLNWRVGSNMLSLIGLEGLEIESVLAESRTAKFDLTLMLTDMGDEIDLEIEYSTDLFDEARIDRMVGHLETLLEAAAADPEIRLSELPLLTEAEHRALAEWNRTEVSYPNDRCLHHLFEEQAQRTPGATAVTFEDRRLTYRELNDRADRLARRLQQLGVAPGRLVAICVERSPEMVVALLGVLKAGGAYIPLDPTYPPERLAYMLGDSDALVILTEERFNGRFETGSVNARVLCIDADLETIAAPADATPTRAAGAEDLAYVIYTSGSTGSPKGVEIRHRNLVNVICAMAKELAFGQKDRLLALTTISFDIAGLELFLPLISGGQVEIAPTSALRDASALRQRLERSRATVVQATPATWAMLIEAGWTGDANLKILCGGEAVTPTLADGLAARAREVWNVYGPTETTIWSSFDRIKSGRAVTIGRPIANTQFHVVDKHGERVPFGVAGELLIGGDGVAKGYFRRPELTAERFVADRFGATGAQAYRTGDLVRRRADGRIEWLARLDHQVKIRGFRIELGEIESALADHPAVREAVVIAREDVPGDKRLVAYLTTTERETPNGSDLRSLLRAKLPEYMVPSAFVVLERFPLTPNGKVDRKALPKPDARASKPSEAVLPLTETQKALADIWRQALGLERIGLDDNFFELGGHSLLALRVIARINRTLRVHANVLQLFQNPTIADLARSLDADGRGAAEPRVLQLQPGRAGPLLYFIGASPVENLIAKCVGGDRAIFGTDVPVKIAWRRALASGNQADLPTIEQLGSLHGEAVRAHAGTSPCVLAGYSFHGKVVVEAARALQRAGGRVASILLIDSNPWTGHSREMRETLRRIARGDANEKAGGADRPAEPIRNSVTSLSWMLAQAGPALKRRLTRLATPGADIEEEDGWFDEDGSPVKLTEMTRLFLERSSFDPAPIDAAAVLFRVPRPGDELLPKGAFDCGWGGRFTRGLEIVESKGDHFSLVRDEQNAAALGRQIRAALDRIDVETGALEPA